jgi:opacity protein-like surface antigen
MSARLGRILSAAALVTLFAPAASARDHVRVLLTGLYGGRTLGFSDTRTFTEFAETGTNTGTFSVPRGSGVGAGVQVAVFQHVGLMAGYTRSNRDQTGTYAASLPHPLYLGQPRAVSGDLPASSFSESAFSVDLFATTRSGRLDLSGWAGVSLFRVEGRLLSSVEYTHAYPYDTVSVTSSPVTPTTDSPTGFDVGAGLDYRLAQHVALGVEGRYSGAKARLESGALSTGQFDVGGFRVGGGLRLIF